MLREDRYRKKMVLGQDGNSLITLLAVIAIVFCVFKFIYVVYVLSNFDKSSYYQNIFQWFSLPAGVDRFLTRPWTLLTYMFVHDGFFPLIGNLIWLWGFGYVLQDLAGNNKIIPLFVFGGLAGGVLYLICYNVFPLFSAHVPVSSLYGSAPGVMALAIGATTLAPRYRMFPMILGGIPLYVFTIIYVLFDVASIPETNGGGHFAHLAGALTGYVFMWRLQKGYDGSMGMNTFFDWVQNLFNPAKKEWKKTAKKDLYYNTRGKEPFKKVANITQKRIDDILDKINQKGFRSLSEEEKEILKRASEGEDL